MDHEIISKMETTKIEDEKEKKAQSATEVMSYLFVCTCVQK